ncbi:MAG: phosphoribosylpyrophosphate synthetase [Saprospiraceae bacterium]|nr:phosphoribosylpyrophosphate synthetase [Saprospiraceae bacterium]
MENYGTLSETINALQKIGYTMDFNIREACLVCQQAGIEMSAEEFKIDKVYRFEGSSNPDDQSILYAISSEKYQIKGVLVNGYGISAEDFPSELVRKLNTHANQESRQDE